MLIGPYYSGEKYMCLSSDIKPTTGIALGAEIYETDTGCKFIFNGVDWIEDLSMMCALQASMEEMT